MENLQGGTLALEHRYFVQQRAGQIGFSTLYQGIQDPFDRPIWLRVFDPLLEAGASPSVFARIKNSAHQTSQLLHEGILRVLDFGEVEHGVPFIVSERLEANSLEDFLVAERTLAPDLTLKLIQRLADILAAAHAQNIVHGCLTPKDIYLPGNSVINAQIGHFQLGLTRQEMLDMPGAVLDTEALIHLPPEAFQDDSDANLNHFSPRADIYALGTIAYQSLVGTHPYFDDPIDAGDAIIRIKNGDIIPLNTLGIDDAISRAVEKALHATAEQRWQSVHAFVDALAQAIAPPKPKIVPQTTEVDTAGHNDHNAPPTVQMIKKAPIEPTQPRLGLPTSSESGIYNQPAPPSLAPNGAILTTAVALFVASNLVWFFFMVWQNDPHDNSTLEQDNSAIITNKLPSGLQIDTKPSGASIQKVDDQEIIRIGSTPYVISPTIQQEGTVHLKVQKPGFADHYLELSQTTTGQNISITLVPSP